MQKKKKSNKIKCSDIGLKHMNLGVKLIAIGPVTHPELFHEAFYGCLHQFNTGLYGQVKAFSFMLKRRGKLQYPHSRYCRMTLNTKFELK